MRNSPTCHRVSAITVALLAVTSAGALWAVDPNRSVSQYVREVWDNNKGFPRGPVYSIEQTKDGYLWIGAQRGLIRFDGLKFDIMDAAPPEQPSLSHVLGLLSEPNGGLLLRLRRPGLTLLEYDNGFFRSPMAELATRASLSAMTRGRDGNPLFCMIEGKSNTIVLRDRKLEHIESDVNVSDVAVPAIAQTPNGEIWIASADEGLFRVRDGKVLAIREGLPDPKVNALAAGDGNDLWIATDGGIVRWDGANLTSAGVPAALRGIQTLALLVDRDKNLWVGTNSRGLARLNSHGVSWMPVGDEAAVTALFEDREGDVWAGRDGALERIRDSAFVTFSNTEGLPSETSGPLHAEGDGALWFAPMHGGLWSLRDGRSERVGVAGLANDVVFSIARGKEGLWLGRRSGGLTLLRAASLGRTYTTSHGLAENSVYSVYESRDGSVWAGTLSGGVSRLDHGRFTTYTSMIGLASNTVTSIAQGADGTMWFATPNGLTAFKDGTWRTFKADALPSEDIDTLLVDSRGVLWIGTENGLAFWRAGRITPIIGPVPGLHERVLGMAEDRNGSLWISTSNHFLRLDGDELLRGNVTPEGVREFTTADGLRGNEGVKRSRSVVSDSEGRIWFSTNRGISVIDPARFAGNSAPSIAHVQTLSADGKRVALNGPIHIAGGVKRLAVDFAGLSLSMPERVRFRYMLEGFDTDWSNPVAEREAVYTNLAPAAYHFRLIASNPDGVWSSQNESLAFSVEPLFWQTWWFRFLVVVVAVLSALLLYRLRLQQLTRRLNLRFEERLAERTRIAQELHDTLLQGFLSASMQVHVANDGLPEDARVKPILVRALNQMGQVIDEGRTAVRGLRASKSASLDLEEAFSQVRQEFGELARKDVDFRVVVDGEQRHMNPLLRDEVYRIGREALLNAFRHSNARHIELELRYLPRQLQMLVRDDGSGIDPNLVKTGREGHFGLSGMRERAAVIGAQFHVFQQPAGGTEVELTVPARYAFLQSSGEWKWFAKWRT